MYELQEILKAVTGMRGGVSLTPMAGAQGELAGVMMIRAYHEARGDHARNEIIVPDAAHGTNPATATMCGCVVKEIPTKDAINVVIDQVDPDPRGPARVADADPRVTDSEIEAVRLVPFAAVASLAGGHFITGAWALVMIYDYHHGRDFADEGLELERSMFAQFDPRLADRYLQRFDGGIRGVDFRRYSRALNPKLKRYDFGFAQLLAAKR